MLTKLIDRMATVWLLFWVSFFAVYIHFGGLAFAGLVILLGGAGWLVWGVRFREIDLPSRPVLLSVLAFLLFFLWLSVSGLWSDYGPGTAIRLGGQMLAMIGFPILLLTRSNWLREVVSHIIMAMALGGIAVLALDVASGYGINIFLDPVGTGEDLNMRQGDAEKNIGRAHVIYALLTPLIISLFATRLSRKAAIAASCSFLLLLFVGTLLNRLAVAPLIVIAAAPLFLIGWRSPRWGLRLSLGTAAASILFAPLVGIMARLTSESVMARLPMSWDHRLRMWDYSLTQIMDAPLIGQGLDASRDMQDAFTTRIGVDVPFVSLHPHNLGIQTWMEAGAIGAILLSLALASLYKPLRQLSRQSPWRGAALSGLMMSAAVGSAITVGAWQYWWWGLIGMAVILLMLIPELEALDKTTIIFDKLAD